jgi:hypothetical protein
MRGTRVCNNSLLHTGGRVLCYKEIIHFLNPTTPPEVPNVYDLDIVVYHCYDMQMEHAIDR